MHQELFKASVSVPQSSPVSADSQEIAVLQKHSVKSGNHGESNIEDITVVEPRVKLGRDI